MMTKSILARLQRWAAFGLLALITSCQFNTETPAPQSGTTASVSGSALAAHWAPIHYQDTDVTGRNSLSGKSDFITAINFDGDWIATNNWNNLAGNYPLAAHGYYSVVETSTHWFILYAFFHARDWTDIFFLYYWDEHENDLEGALFIVQKDGSAYGRFQAMVTVAHSDFFSFVPSGSILQANEENVDGPVNFENFNGNARPLTAQEAKGHGLKAYPAYKLNGDGIKYYPSPTVTDQIPANADDRYVEYRLVDIFEPGGLWEQRTNTQCFSSPTGSFLKSVGNGSANPPWAWDDKDDSPARGTLATDPASLVQAYFKNLGSFSRTYVHNPYIGIE